MIKISLACSDEILLVEAEGIRKRYEVGSLIKFKTNEGIFVKGLISAIRPDDISVFHDESDYVYKMDDICEVDL